MSVVEPQVAEQVSVHEDDQEAELDNHPPRDAITSEQSEPGDSEPEAQSESGALSLPDAKLDENAVPQELEQAQVVQAAEAIPVRKVSGTATPTKEPMSVSTNVAKANGGPTTPLVKKILNSGTFGAGSVKPAPVVKSSVSGSAIATKPAAAASSLKRANTAAPSAASKPTTTTAPKATSTAPAPNRRASLVPSSAKPTATSVRTAGTTASSPVKPRVSSITKPGTAEPSKARASVASPTSSVASAKAPPPATRPKATVTSDAVKKPAASRTATGTATSRVSSISKPPASRTVSSSALKSKPTASIASIKEVKEDTKANEALRLQLKEVEESLQSKTDAVGTLEGELEKLQGSFQTALEDVEAKTARVQELEAAKATLEAQLKDLEASVEADNARHNSLLDEVKGDLEVAKAASVESANQVEKLQAQIAELEDTVTKTKESLDSLRATQATALADAGQASEIERAALAKAQSDFEEISKETEALQVAQADALQAAQAKIAELEPKAAELDSVRSEVEELKAEKEESANKISELEVEVLELKEQIEELEETQSKLQAKIASLETDLSAKEQAVEDAKRAVTEHEAEAKSRIELLTAEQAQELSDAAQRFTAVQDTLRSVEDQLSGALAAQEQAAKDVVAVQAAHDAQIQELEAAHAAKQAELSAQMAAVQENLDNQEAIYNGKVQGVKDEHEVLLKEAFERAKSEAGAAHAQELQNLRAESNATIAQIQLQNKTNTESLQSDHDSELEASAKSYNKQIGNLNLELKATQDDLVKSKATLEEVRKELEAVKQQRDAAQASASAAPAVSQEHVDEVARLKKELAVSKDDLAAVTDMLNLTKSSLTEMSEKHQADVEESAKTRAEEALKISAAHDEELRILASQKSELLVKLSDLEGDLSTAKAALAAALSASPKTNGSPPRAPTSPGVTKEELAKLHEAHTHKVYDLEAEHEKAMKALKEELEKSHKKAADLEAEVARKDMEVRYLETDQEESQNQITALKERLGETEEA